MTDVQRHIRQEDTAHGQPSAAQRDCAHDGGSRTEDGKWKCGECGYLFADYWAWCEATDNWSVAAAIAADLGVGE